MKPAVHRQRAATHTLARHGTGRPAFTLVELLVTITIIGVLASLFLAAMASTAETGRIAATRATIAKIHNLVMQRYEMYRTRRVPITIVTTSGVSPITAAGWRVDGLRDLMRLEMPDSWSDIINADGTPNYPLGYTTGSPNGLAPTTNRPCVPPPSLFLAYVRKFNAITTANKTAGKTTIPSINPNGTATARSTSYVVSGNANTPSPMFEGAECLYMICTTGISDELDTQEQFRQNEVGDVDSDGAFEFIDAWGTPIDFLRWAPGFYSELQTHNDADPFDPRHVYPSVSGATGATTYPTVSSQTTPTFALYPLIYSAGPDKSYGINAPLSNGTPSTVTAKNDDPFWSYYSPAVTTAPIGQPYDSDGIYGEKGGTLEAADNVHNHMVGGR